MTGLSVRNVSYAYGDKRALDDVSFHVPQGAFCALLGPNGAGKSTLFSLLTRLFTTAQGVIEVAGFDISKQPRQALAQIGVVFQQPTLDLDLTVHRNLSYFAALHGLSGRAAETRITAALERLDMAERASERTRDLNGGHRRRLEIARCLIHAPSVLLLDEPTVGLDAAARSAITQHVHDLSAQDGLTVLWATHLTDEITPDDQLAILHRGKMLTQGTCRDITGDQPLQKVFLSMTGAAT
ncbi:MULTISPECIES: ABC transporter ATP-binding protein [unclassified Ruegeria]|uniref:ABC transporter ATP-binding protein n=1 Tax=unclassified Ruegeria TaxID=2625375 RepID=UPI0012683EE5|nr:MULTISPECIES: ABC transporter ATP-binding protein [unclassified Ruegeria]QFT75605.1 putative ABC transporter ATP-binding protein YbhF [Ruegeria sp. THAF33]UAB90975.1 ATP-binding cassette domain-containing protein [Ruegeria sp. SCSIO 43209]